MLRIFALKAGISAALLAFSCSNTWSATFDNSVECVQQQLTTLNIDIGVIDGAFGKLTKSGIETLLSKIENGATITLVPVPIGDEQDDAPDIIAQAPSPEAYEAATPQDVHDISYRSPQTTGSVPAPEEGVLKPQPAFEVMQEDVVDLGSYPFRRLAGVKSITKDNALIWCREIGLAHPTLQQYWPSEKGPVLSYIFSDSLPKFTHKRIEKVSQLAFDFYKDRDLKLAGDIKIIASGDLSDLAELVSTHVRGKVSYNSAMNRLRKNCSSGDFSGVSYDGTIAICFNPFMQWNQNTELWLSRVIVNKMAHEIQKQYAGYTPKKLKYVDFPSKRGPTWLYEGMASALELEYAYTPYKLQRSLLPLKHTYSHFSGAALSKFTPYKSSEHEDFKAFKVLGGERIKALGGTDAFFGYWQRMARHDWQTAFQNTYGITIDEFYARF